jgi:hypothetical protein
VGNVIRFPQPEPPNYDPYGVERRPLTQCEQRDARWAFERGLSYEEMLCEMWEFSGI